VAFVEVGDLATAASDFATYRSQFGLGSGTLTKYNEYGQQSKYPPTCQNYGWCIAADLDIEMVSAACPKCNILLIEAKDSVPDLETAEAEAVTLGAAIVSNSWSCPGSYDCGDKGLSKYFDTPGVTYLAASGDAYGNIGAPAALASVIAVGGTQLVMNGSKYSETLWYDSGGGCADPSEVGGSGIPKPSWQSDPDCKYRTVVDVSAEAGCEPGVSVYSGTYGGGWLEYCGTGVSTPFTAGVIALAGNAGKLEGGKTFWTFDSKQHQRYFLHPSGTGEGSCGDYLCGQGRYEEHYSGPGGWGSPNGIKGY
jgi:subtilase family serine protease